MRMEHWWFTAQLRLRSILRRNLVEQELDQELQFHLEHKIEEGIARGLSPKQARNAAMLAMDGLEQRKKEIRDTRRIDWLTDFLDDVHYAIRSLRRSSGLTAFVAITLALGIGLTAISFSTVDALIFRPYPVPHPGGVVSLVSTSHDNSFDNFSYREYLDIRGQTKSYEGVIANANLGTVGFSVDSGTTPRARAGMMVSGNYFSTNPQKHFFDDRDDRELNVKARLKRGKTTQQAHSELAVLAQNFEREYPQLNRNRVGPQRRMNAAARSASRRINGSAGYFQ